MFYFLIFSFERFLSNSFKICIFSILTGAPYSGKASDMWALGVVLFTMLYGQFPFYDNVPHELFRKIKAADYKMPKYVHLFNFNVTPQVVEQCFNSLQSFYNR